MPWGVVTSGCAIPTSLPFGSRNVRIFSKSRGKSRTLLRLDRQIQPPGDGFDNPSRAYTGTKLFLPQDIEKIQTPFGALDHTDTGQLLCEGLDFKPTNEMDENL